MVRKQLVDYSILNFEIVRAIEDKVNEGKFDQSLHDIFNRGQPKLYINHIRQIIDAIERRLRISEKIFYTYFDSEFDANIIISNILVSYKIIESEFSYDGQIFRGRIEFQSSVVYKETINMKFQSFLLNISIIYENIVRLIETLLKKVVVFGGIQVPHQSIPLGRLIDYWDNLVKLNYRGEDGFYLWLDNNRDYFNKYLKQINKLRNSLIHGYSLNLFIDNSSSFYVINNYDKDNFPEVGGNINSDLIVNEFVKSVVDNTERFTLELLTLIKAEVTSPSVKLPM